MKKQIFFILFFCYSLFYANAQNINISGYIKEAQTKEIIYGTYITSSNSYAISNEYGYFNLQIPKGKSKLSIHFLGYKPLVVNLNLTGDTLLNFYLKKQINLINEVTVSGNKIDEFMHNSISNINLLKSSEIKDLSPPILGEADLMKSIQTLPGIQGGREGTTELHVRGGDQSENIILLDGIPIYNTSHLLGLLSVFNVDAINNVKILKGGFPARYGGRLSSVIDINLKEGSHEKFSGSLNLSPIASKLTLQSPIGSKSSFLVSTRYSFLSTLSAIYQKQLGNPNYLNYTFYDITAKINRQINAKNKIFLSIYSSHDGYINKVGEIKLDKVSEEKDYSLGWGNKTALLRWNHRFSNQYFSNLSLYYSHYQFNSTEGRKGIAEVEKKLFDYEQTTFYSSGIEEGGLKWSMDLPLSNRFFIRTGSSVSLKQYDPSSFANNSYKDTSIIAIWQRDTIANNMISNVIENHNFIENQIKLGSKGELNIGLHWSNFINQSTYYYSLEPRVSMGYNIIEKMAIKGSFSQMKQYEHLLAGSMIGVPTDLWMPADNRIPPQKSWQVTSGLYFSPSYFQISIELYYKKLNSLTLFEQGFNFLDVSANLSTEKLAYDWRDHVAFGSGKSKGLEISMIKNTGKFQTQLSYTLSKTTRQFKVFNGGEEFPYQYDRKHIVDLFLNYQITNHLKFNAHFNYMSGFHISVPMIKYPEHYYAGFKGIYPDGQIHYATDNYHSSLLNFSIRNNYQTPAYHRLDLSLEYKREKNKKIRTWNFGLYNVYNRHNIFSIFNIAGQLRAFSLLPVLPSISYKYEF